MKQFQSARLTSLIALCIVTVLTLSLSACKVPAVEWPDVAHCTGDVTDHIGTVGQILLADGPDAPLSDGNKAELARIGADVGADVVSCIVGRWIDRWSSPGAARSPEVVSAEMRGRSWLEENGTTLEPPAGGW
jgi:hypothetical protein